MESMALYFFGVLLSVQVFFAESVRLGANNPNTCHDLTGHWYSDIVTQPRSEIQNQLLRPLDGATCEAAECKRANHDRLLHVRCTTPGGQTYDCIYCGDPHVCGSYNNGGQATYYKRLASKAVSGGARGVPHGCFFREISHRQCPNVYFRKVIPGIARGQGFVRDARRMPSRALCDLSPAVSPSQQRAAEAARRLQEGRAQAAVKKAQNKKAQRERQEQERERQEQERQRLLLERQREAAKKPGSSSQGQGNWNGAQRIGSIGPIGSSSSSSSNTGSFHTVNSGRSRSGSLGSIGSSSSSSSTGSFHTVNSGRSRSGSLGSIGSSRSSSGTGSRSRSGSLGLPQSRPISPSLSRSGSLSGQGSSRSNDRGSFLNRQGGGTQIGNRARAQNGARGGVHTGTIARARVGAQANPTLVQRCMIYVNNMPANIAHMCRRVLNSVRHLG